ncbi:hypothetical protein HK413_02820 [Mucilaginibacter sp. S1162]|uniref:Uncharacterized protein n=1 Tax=Mucilaginibacter humi TaxID=2732510 RepID=A0ABX1W4Z3_9SPHI|nr:hypothetical protein [Mucilaginibacter humi]NNU33360.1 hypothetical protein [Mucilaginibacter humi]
MVISTPLIECLSNFNQRLQLPHFLDGVQRWMRETEDPGPKAYSRIAENENHLKYDI